MTWKERYKEVNGPLSPRTRCKSFTRCMVSKFSNERVVILILTLLATIALCVALEFGLYYWLRETSHTLEKGSCVNTGCSVIYSNIPSLSYMASQCCCNVSFSRLVKQTITDETSFLTKAAHFNFNMRVKSDSLSTRPGATESSSIKQIGNDEEHVITICKPLKNSGTSKCAPTFGESICWFNPADNEVWFTHPKHYMQAARIVSYLSVALLVLLALLLIITNTESVPDNLLPVSMQYDFDLWIEKNYMPVPGGEESDAAEIDDGLFTTSHAKRYFDSTGITLSSPPPRGRAASKDYRPSLYGSGPKKTSGSAAAMIIDDDCDDGGSSSYEFTMAYLEKDALSRKHVMPHTRLINANTPTATATASSHF